MYRHAALFACALLSACGPAAATLPRIPDQTPYGEVRERMIRAGFLPVKVDHRWYSYDEPPRPADQWCPADSDQPICVLHPELMYCTLGMLERCGWLYRARGGGGRYAVVTTRCSNFETKYCFETVRWADDEAELKDYLIAPFGNASGPR